MDTISKNILILLARSQSPVAAQQIADEFGVTSRIVHYRLSQVELWLEARGIHLVKKPGEGIFLALDNRERQDLLKALTTMPVGAIFLTPTERLQILILTLIFSSQPMVIKQFEQKLNVSRTTILKDLETIDQWLSAHDLILSRRPNFGCIVIGSERQLRAAMVDALMEIIANTFSNRLEDVLATAENDYKKTDTAYLHQLAEFLGPLELRYFNHLVNGAAEEDSLVLRESAHQLLVIYLAVSTYRFRNNHPSEPVEEISKFPKISANYEIANKLITSIQKRFSLHLPESSTADLILVLHRIQDKNPKFKVTGTSFVGIREYKELAQDYDPAILGLVEVILDRASTYLHPSLRVDAEIILSLANHLTNLIKHPNARMPIKNPILAEVKREYPYIYKVAEECAEIINREHKLVIPEDEIGYIAMYLAASLERMCIPLRYKKRLLVVCNAGGATAALLVSRIQSEFSDMEIIAVMSYRELVKKAHLLDFNLVVSTIPIDIKDVPFVVVSPLLTAGDIRRVREMVKSQSISSLVGDIPGHHSSGFIHLVDLIIPKTINLKMSASNWQEVVEKAGEPLVALHTIEPRYISAMKNIIMECGPYMVIWPGVALLHARPDEGVNRLSMSLVTLKTPIAFGHPTNDPVDIAIVLGAVNNNSHLTALFELNTVMQKPFSVQMLRNSVSHMQVRSILANP
jgi:mannitol operon transcriptional antiterminator